MVVKSEYELELPDEVKGMLTGFIIAMLIICIPFMFIYIDHWNRKDEEITSKITSIYVREEKHGKTDRYTRYSVCSTEKDGRIDLEVSNMAKVGDEIKYLKSQGPLGIVPTFFKRK